MTTWIGVDKTRVEIPINRETYDILLRENGEYLLRETILQDWLGTTKNTANWSGQSKNTANWSSPIKN